MENIRNNRKVNRMFFCLAMIIFAETVIFLPDTSLGISLESKTFAPTVESATLVVLLIVFSLLTSLVVTRIYNRSDEKLKYIAALLVANPLFFLTNNSNEKIFVSIIGLCVVLISLKFDSEIFPMISLPLFVLISATFLSDSIHSFIPVALAVYLLKNNAKILPPVLSFAALGIGLFLNEKFFTTKNESTVFGNSSMGTSPTLEFIILLLLIALTLSLEIWFFFNIVKSQKELINKIYTKKTDKAMMKNPSAIIVIFSLQFILSVIGFFLKGIDAFCMMSMAFPIMITTLISGNDALTDKALEKMNGFIDKHIFAFLAAFVAVTCVTLYATERYIIGIKIIEYLVWLR